MSILFIDTETTGKLIKGMPLDEPQQPRIVQLAAILTDDQAGVLAQINLLVYPDGWTIPDEATQVHGIKTEDCERHGLKISLVLDLLRALSFPASMIVAHNLDFDMSMVAREFLLLDDLDSPFRGRQRYCTMKAATPVCGIPGPYGLKWPTLAEAHHHLLGCDFDNAHDAMADVAACMRIFFKLRELENHQQPKEVPLFA